MIGVCDGMRTSLAFGPTVCVLGPWGDRCVRRHADFVSFRANSLCVGAMG